MRWFDIVVTPLALYGVVVIDNILLLKFVAFGWGVSILGEALDEVFFSQEKQP